MPWSGTKAFAEAAVIGRHDEDKGQAVFAYVTLENDTEGSEELEKSLIQHVRKQIGPLASPDDLVFTEDLPKTRSGKIMRRVLRSVARKAPTTWATPSHPGRPERCGHPPRTGQRADLGRPIR